MRKRNSEGVLQHPPVGEAWDDPDVIMLEPAPKRRRNQTDLPLLWLPDKDEELKSVHSSDTDGTPKLLDPDMILETSSSDEGVPGDEEDVGKLKQGGTHEIPSRIAPSPWHIPDQLIRLLLMQRDGLLHATLVQQ